MKTIHQNQIEQAVATLCIDANYNLSKDVLNAIKKAKKLEKSNTSKKILDQLIKNATIATTEQIPICQDTGFLVVFIELGQNVKIQGNLYEAITNGVKKGYKEGFLRKSIVSDPLKRINTNDNTPPIIHTKINNGDNLKIVIIPKGGGSENMSALKMLTPSDGIKGVEEFILNRIRNGGGKPCPPIIVGVGIGGTFDFCAYLAKKALLRKIGERNKDPFYANFEKSLFEKINKLGIGSMGVGGTQTALEVFIETYPCHIASLPVAINIQCHAARHAQIIL